MATTLSLPGTSGRLEPYTVRNAPLPTSEGRGRPSFNRVAYAAAHVVVDPLAESDPFLDAVVDWDITFGISASASRKPWIRPSAGWASTGRARWS